MPTELVMSYIDGFNLYFGLKEMGWSKYYWMNVGLLSSSLLNNRQFLGETHYFTSRITRQPTKQRRQSTFLEALTAIGIVPKYGKYRHNAYRCFNSNTIHQIPQEKITDVYIATQLLTDAFNNRFETALIISGDIDLIPAVKAVRRMRKRVIVAFPPMRYTSELERIADGCLRITERHCRKSQLPVEVLRGDGYILKRPPEWS